MMESSIEDMTKCHHANREGNDKDLEEGNTSEGSEELRPESSRPKNGINRIYDCAISHSCMSRMKKQFRRRCNCCRKLRRQLGNTNKFILGISIFIFAVLLAAGVAISIILTDSQADAKENQAMDLAKETGEWFSDQLNQAILPLFSMAQFALEIPIFRNLPQQIGPAGEPGSLPFLPPNEFGGPYTHRNVTGVCDDPDLIERYNGIAATIKANANMEGVLVNLQLAPEAVVCLLYPLINTEDFPDGISLNNTGARGLDLLTDPINSFIAKSTIPTETVAIAGPLSLRQCRESSCAPAVEKAFIARLPIPVPDNTIQVDGIAYERWGFATALINWEALVIRSDIYQQFEDRGMEFQLTRTDRKLNPTTNQYDSAVVVLAETPNFSSKTQSRKAVTTALQTTNNEWKMTVFYDDLQSDTTKVIILVVCVILSFCIAVLVFVVLLQRHRQLELMAASQAQAASVETERNMTAYFAHELRNPLSAIDSALCTMPDDLPDSVRELISSMQICTGFMASIMNNLLEVRKMEEGKMELETIPMSLEALIAGVHKMLLPSVNPGVSFITEIDTIANDWVVGDLHRIQQVLTNVISNAMKFTVSGSITLSVGWVEDRVKIKCIDTSPGIPIEQQELMFERFVQRGNSPGSGLGLAVSRYIVTLMGGTMHFESDPSIKPGTTCVILLPLPKCNLAAPLSPSPSSSSSSSSSAAGEFVGVMSSVSMHMDTATQGECNVIEDPLSFLIVDDLKMNRLMLKRRLKEKIAPNCTITEAATGEEALQLCMDNRFDIITVDQFMEEAGGVMLGCEVVREMRRLSMDCIIIGSSANDLNDEFLQAGADWTWRKPIPSNSEMIRRLRAALAGK